MKNSACDAYSDDHLSFANLLYMQFASDGTLLRMRPDTASFLGWHAGNLDLFDFQQHFLSFNHLSMDNFFNLFSQGISHSSSYLWSSADGQQQMILNSLCEIDADGTGNYSVLIKNTPPGEISRENPLDKKFCFQAQRLPGILHNLGGAIGTLTGRADLLRIKYPQINDFKELSEVGISVKDLLGNLRFKIRNEKAEQALPIHLNRFLDEELKFLRHDLFFKHHIKVIPYYEEGIPQFTAKYDALSGILAESYNFFRQFMDDHKNYRCIVRSLRQENEGGFQLRFTGEFGTHTLQGATLPFQCEISEDCYREESLIGFDKNFVCNCLKYFKGTITLSGQGDEMVIRFVFPLPEETELAYPENASASAE